MTESAMASSFNTLSVETHGSVRYICLNRPHKHNAINLEMMRELRSAIAAATAAADIHVVVLAAVGGRSFSAGIDLSAGILDDVAGMKQSMINDYLPLSETMAACDKPIIASVEGAAIGLACSIVLHCDLLFMSEHASLNMVFNDMGLVGDGGINWLLPRKIGYNKAFELLLEAKKLTAAECLHIGIANRILPSHTMAGTVREVARNLAHRACLPQGLTKKLMAMTISGASLRDVILSEANAQAECVGSDYFQQAYARFLGKE
jgi:2-(1,2-epoxy-1,2-dihydrophenyl)acetyl-CoA isomerase